MKKSTLTVLVVDDRRLDNSRLHATLQHAPRVDVVGKVESHSEAITVQRRVRADVVLIDAAGPAVDAQVLTKMFALGIDGPPVNVLVLVTGMDAKAWNIFRSGARGIVLKHSVPQRLLAAIELVATGYVVLACPRRPVAPVPDPPDHGAAAGPAPLTARETEVLSQIGHGYSNARISRNLQIQETTVKTHVRSVLDKLALQNRVQAAVYAHRSGLVQQLADPGE